MKKTLKWIGLIIGIPVMLVFILALLFYFPPFQQWAVKKVTAYASQQTGMNIHVGEVRLAFPLDLALGDVQVIQQNDSLPQVKDTIAAIGKLIVDVQLMPLLSQQIQIDQLEFHHMKLNTTNMIAAARVNGVIGKLAVMSHGIDLKAKTFRLNKALLSDANLMVTLSDSVPKDTSTTKNFWKIKVDGLDIRHTAFTVKMPGDTLDVQAYLGNAIARNGLFDLGSGHYQLNKLDWTDGRLQYDNRFAPRTKGLDYNHLVMTDVRVGVDSLDFKAPKLEMRVRQMAFREKSGLDLQELSGPIKMDSSRVYLHDLKIRTSESAILADFFMDLNSFSKEAPGQLNATLHASLGKQDLMRFMVGMPSDFRKKWPNAPLQIDGIVRGNMQSARMTGLHVKLPSVLTANASGTMSNLTDPRKLKADVHLEAVTGNLDMVKAMLDAKMQKQVNIPRGIRFKGHVKVNGSQYGSTFIAQQGGGSLKGMAAFDAGRMAYHANLTANRLPLQHFLPNQGFHPFSGLIRVKGKGTDIFSPKTSLTANMKVTQFQFGQYFLNNISADAQVRNGHAKAVVNSNNSLAKGNIVMDALTHSKTLNAVVKTNLTHLDLKNLHLTEDSIILAMRGSMNISTNLKRHYQIQGVFDQLKIIDNGMVYEPGSVTYHLLTRPDTTFAKVISDDLRLELKGNGGYQKLLKESMGLLTEAKTQYQKKYINQTLLRSKLPKADIYLISGKNNLLVNILRKYQVDLDSAMVNITSSPVGGLNGSLLIDKLSAGGVRLDTVRLRMASSELGMTYHGQVRNNQDNPQYVFNALFDGAIHEHGTNVRAKFYDDKDKLGLNLGLVANMVADGIEMKVDSTDLVLGYDTYRVNSDNYLLVGNHNRISANMKLKSASGNGIQLFSNDGNVDALQDVTVSLHQFDLEKLLSVIPYTPNIGGIMNGDFHVLQTSSELSISSAIDVKKLSYENSPMGNISTEFVYMPKSDGTHFVDGILLSEGKEVAALSGTYDKNGYLDASMNLEHIPLLLLNGFIPDRLFGFKGNGDGTLSVKGSLSKPHIDGEVFLDSSYIYSEPYGVEMRFANDPVRIVDSRLLFENFEMFANNKSPLDIAGYFDFSNLSDMKLDIQMRAQNFELIHAEENLRSQAFGKAFVNFYGTMKGPVDNLKFRGMLNVLGSTDMTYILKDSELATDKQMEELITFANFNDSVPVVVLRPKLNGFDMDLNVSIDEAAHIVCILNADHTNYIDLYGGGELRMRYNPNDNLRLFGRYTLGGGEMKYSLPIIPLKTFTIQNGSYIEFVGDPMNPQLNITATENLKASVNEGTGLGRVVEFNSGVKLTKSLSSPGLEFIINSPYDMTIQDELNTMTPEGRGKVAITMLASGMYLTDGNTRSFSMNSALSSFLQSEINNIAGSAMRSMGLDLGMSVDNMTTNSGSMSTNYNFRFSKRLWNNRLRINIGGRVSAGDELMANRNNSFFDNVELEYRLNENASQYLRFFYNNNTYDWLEGLIGEYGVGFTWRRKLSNFKDIFLFKNEKQTFPTFNPVRTDSISNENSAKKK